MTEIKLNVPGTVITCGESKLPGIDHKRREEG